MKRTSNLLAFSLLALAATADAEPRKPMAGSRAVDAFSAIELAGMMAVEVRIGPATTVDVQGEPQLAKLISTTVKKGSLIIDTPDDFAKRLEGHDTNKLKVVITMPALTAVAITGTGAMEVEGLAQKSFNASIPGTGSLELTGKADTFRLSIPGTGEVKAKTLIASDVLLSVPGTAQASLHATKSFEANVQGTAVVKVHGKPPTVKKNVVGTAMIDVK
jgi:hypothetical protein